VCKKYNMTDNRVRDPIYGYIRVRDIEREILDTKWMQRLRRISQLSTTSLVYPGATHTRFSHSLGVMHIAGKIGESIGLSDDMIQMLRISGLVHDIGHGPFSHTSDRVAMKNGYSHEQNSCEIIENKIGHLLPEKVDMEKIKSQIKGEAAVNIISGDVDADKIDYLNRDSKNIGIEHGTIDYRTIIEFAKKHDGQLGFSRKCTHALNELLTARLRMHSVINNHHSARLADTMLERCLEQYVNKYSVTKLFNRDDYEMHYELLNSSLDNIKDLYTRITERNLPKRAHSVQGVTRGDIQRLSNIDVQSYEEEIAEEAGVTESSVFMVTPTFISEPSPDIKILANNRTQKLSDISEIPDRITKQILSQSRIHVYSNEEETEQVSRVSESFLSSIVEDG